MVDPQPGLNIPTNEKYTLDRALRAGVRLGGLDLNYLTFSISDSIDGIFPSIKLGPNGIIFNDNTVMTTAAGAVLPDQTGQNGKFLTTDGTNPAWALAPTGLPDQSGQGGKFLTTNGSVASWATGGGGGGIVGLSSDGTTITATLPFQFNSTSNFSSSVVMSGLSIDPFAITLQSNSSVSGTYTPDLSLGQSFYLELTGNTTFANPINTTNMVVGSLIKLYCKQDSTGYRTLAFGNKYLNASNFMPRQGPNQTSMVEFVWNGDSTVNLLNIDGIDITQGFNITDWGATLNLIGGTVSSSTAIQNALEFSASLYATTGTQPTIYFPGGGEILIDKPIFIRDAGQRLIGQGTRQGVLSVAPNFFGPLIINGVDHTTSLGGNNGPTYVSAIVTGPGQAIQMGDAGSGAFFDLSQNPFGRLPHANWTMDWYAKFDTGSLAAGAGRPIIGIWGALADFGSGPLSDPVLLQVVMDSFDYPSTPAVLTLNAVVGGVGTNIILGTVEDPNVLEGVVYHYELSWDGTVFRFFINGNQCVGSPFTPDVGDGSGFVHQLWHQLTIGAGVVNKYPGAVEEDYVNYVLDSFEIANAVLHTSNFTPTFAKTVQGFNTTMLLNFDNFLHECMIASTSAGTHSYFVPWCGESGTVGIGIELRNMFLQGGWMMFDFAPNLIIDNIYHNLAYGEWKFWNACILHSISNLSILQGEWCRAMIVGSSMSEGVWSNINLTGQIGAIYDECNFVANDFYVDVNSTAICALVLNGEGGTYNFTRFTIDNENGGQLIAGVIIDSPQSCTFDSSTIVTNFGPSGSPAAMVLQNINPSAYVAQPVVDFRNCFWQTFDDVTPCIDTTLSTFPSAQAVTISNPLRINNAPFYKGASVKVNLDRIVTGVADTNYAATTSDRIIAFTSITAARTVTLPAANTIGNATQLIIKDQSGNCSNAKTITIQVASSGTIDGVTTKVISVPYGGLSLYGDGTNYYGSSYDLNIVLTDGLTLLGGLSADDGSGASVQIGGAQSVDGNLFFKKRTPVADTNYVGLATDFLIAFTSITAARTVMLPTPTSALSGQRIVVKDESGSCSSGNTIAVSTADGGSVTINTAFGVRHFYCNGTAWFSE